MKHSSSELLEFEQLKQLVGRFIAGPLGRLELEKVEPGSDRAQLEEALAETAEAMDLLRGDSKPPLTGLADCTMAVQKLRIEGAVLEGREIADLTMLLDRVTQIRSLLQGAPRLAARVSGLADFRPLLKDLTGKIQPDGQVADHASVALNRIRRDKEKQQRLIQESLEKFLKAHRDEGVLQEEYVTVRNDRFVVPVVAGQRRKVDGVIHGASGSGQTLFVEPLATIDLNNELVRLSEEELREIYRILRDLSEKLRVHAASIRDALDVISSLDLLFAKAAFAVQFRCVIPKFSARIHLKDARHPLLEDVLKKQRKAIVPVSLTLDDRTHTLLISGPNTGGKTVTMKTVGLLALMAHAALPVPAQEAEFPVFDQVLADIGDNQSIEQSLSTFSAHIATVKEMVEDATPDSLILLDELGRATDPEEGGALGVAILDHFRELRVFTLASTHLLALKVYGANTASVLNASMGFDEATLEPTFVLRLGAPGKSAGLDIATRLGMPQRLIERARSAMSTTERDIAHFLNELHQGVERNAALEMELRQKVAAATAKEQSLAVEWERRESAKLREVDRKFEELTAKFEVQARQTIENIEQSGVQKKAAEQALRKVAKTKREFQEDMESQVLSTANPDAPPPRRLELREGSRVLLRGISQPARVRRLLDEDTIEVDAGLMKMKVSRADVREVLPDAPEAGLPKGVSYKPGPRWDVPYQEINVIGKRAEEAMDEVEKFLDHAAMASVERVRIVHGHGMGVLKRAVADLLSKSPHVQKFYQASQGEGGAGATVAELKVG
jgi:DNA mismatch repair protein MutS2